MFSQIFRVQRVFNGCNREFRVCFMSFHVVVVNIASTNESLLQAATSDI